MVHGQTHDYCNFVSVSFNNNNNNNYNANYACDRMPLNGLSDTDICSSSNSGGGGSLGGGCGISGIGVENVAPSCSMHGLALQQHHYPPQPQLHRKGSEGCGQWQPCIGAPFMQQQAAYVPHQYYPTMLEVDPSRLRSNGKPKRRRTATLAQRKAANIRERKRMFNLNEAFDVLRKKVPTFAYEKRLSRIETLRLAITYISFMSDVVNGKNPEDVNLREMSNNKWLSLKTLVEESLSDNE